MKRSLSKVKGLPARTGLSAALVLCLLLVLPAGLGAEEPKGTLVLNSTFADGKDDGWRGRGSVERGNAETVAVVTTAQHDSPNAIKVSGRQNAWNGLTHAIAPAIQGGELYRVSAWVYYDEGPDNVEFILSTEKSYTDPKAAHSYANIFKEWADKGVWLKLEAEVEIPKDPSLAMIDIYVESPENEDGKFSDFYLDDIQVVRVDQSAKIEIQENLPNLGEAFLEWFPLGAAIAPEFVAKDNPHFRLLTKHFTAISAENAMKPESLLVKEGEYNYTNADRLVDFSVLTGMRLRGHTLVWHSQTPSWFFQDAKDPSKNATKAVVLKRLESYIQNVAGHFAGNIDTWDVVNEVISDGEGTNGLRNGAERSKWFEICGPEYIEKAFIWAKKADPDAKLYINDYGLEGNPGKQQRMLKLLADLKKKKVPVDGVGLQMHINLMGPSAQQIRETIEVFAKAGYKVQVTEMDMSIYLSRDEKYKEPTAELLNQQARRYAEIFEVFKDCAKKGQLDMVVLWGTDDAQSWLNSFPVVGRNDAALLFDRGLQAKPAFDALLNPDKYLKAPAAGGTKTATASSGTPVVDGKIDDAWKNTAVFTTDAKTMGDKAATGKFRFLWDQKFLYVLAEVSDPVLSAKSKDTYQQDSVEVFIDQDNKKGAYEKDDAQYRVSFKGKVSVDHGSKKDFKPVVALVDGGYVVEMAIPLTAIKPAKGTVMGLDFQINDDDGSGARTGVRAFNDATNSNWQSTATFGLIELK